LGLIHQFIEKAITMTVYSELSDQELISRLSTDDEGLAFEEIFNRYQPLLLSFTYKKVNDQDKAKDILQDIFIQLWNNRAELKILTLSSYLYTMALNKIRDLYKRQVIHDEHISKLQQLISESRGDADHRIREKDISRLIELEIAALPEKMRQVFLLRKNAFLTNREISEKLGISEQTVETHMKRALKTLKSRLGPAIFLLGVLS
jgi:RNA polymerase sigma-70 factor (family 1)